MLKRGTEIQIISEDTGLAIEQNKTTAYRKRLKNCSQHPRQTYG